MMYIYTNTPCNPNFLLMVDTSSVAIISLAPFMTLLCDAMQYSMCSLTATARLAGMVHGVVVQINTRISKTAAVAAVAL